MPHVLQGWSHIATQGMMPWLAAGGGVAAVCLVVLLARMAIGRRDRVSRGSTRLTLAQQRALERDMGRLVNELAEMSRQVGTQLDAQSLRLEELIDAADERIERLERSGKQASAEVVQARQTILAAEIVEPPRASTLPAHLALEPIDAEARVVEPADVRAAVDERHVEIYTLADQGLAMAEIARRLRKPSGEVELILALRPTVTRARR